MWQAHNQYRARHCAPSMTLDDELNQSAQAYAEKLVQLGQLIHSGRNGVGENLYATWSSAPLTKLDGKDQHSLREIKHAYELHWLLTS